MDDRTAGAGGPGALPQSPRAGPAAGELVTETLDYDGGRHVTVYVPPDPPRAVVFAGHGQGVPRWGGTLEAAGVPPTMIVDVHGLADETMRLRSRARVPATVWMLDRCRHEGQAPAEAGVSLPGSTWTSPALRRSYRATGEPGAEARSVLQSLHGFREPRCLDTHARW